MCRLLNFRPRRTLTVFGLVSAILGASPMQAQVVQQAIGGVHIDAAGVVQRQSVDARDRLRKDRAAALRGAPDDMRRFSPLRKISLRRLGESLQAGHRRDGAESNEIRFLAGLQQIRFVFVYPEHGDIVLAGPAEGWQINHEGAIVGQTTNLPVLQLDDLIVALRASDAASTTGITCSIEPTSDGVARLKNYFRGISTVTSQTAKDVREILGLQNVIVQGVPGDSRFANVLVAADFRMKRLAMGFDDAPIAGLPSFLELAAHVPLGNMMPRWWLAPNYDPLLRDEEGLAWEIRGARVKTLVEQDVLVQGKRQASGNPHPLARRWAELMTQHYDELSARDTVFRELRNCIDLAIVSALIFRHRLDEQAGLSLSNWRDDSLLPTDRYPTARQVDTLTTVRRKRGGWEISASGGVDIDPWQIVSRQETGGGPADARSAARGGDPTRWWWD